MRAAACAAVLVLCAALLGAAAGRLPSRPAAAPSTFVDRALGPRSSDASLERRLVTGATLAVDRTGLDVHVGAATIALSSSGANDGAWLRYPDGVARPTGFGRESILFGINRAEQFLTVDQRQGTRTWSWQLDVSDGSPRLDSGGGVTFARAGHLLGARILPVEILDRNGRDLTPAGAHWTLDRQGSSWRLGLRLDDAKLPVPYLIDPVALVAACALPAGPGGTTSCTAATSTGSSSLGITEPSAAVSGDVMVAQVVVGSAGAITAPAGWSQIGTTAQDASAPLEQAVFWHRVDGTESSPITFSWAGGSADASGGIVTYKGVDPFVGFDQGGSAVTSMTSGGTAATGTPAGLAVTTTAANEMLQAAYGVANAVTVAQSAGQGLTREWTASSAGTTKVTAGFSDGAQAAAGASGNKTATWATSSLWAAHLFALKNEAADGSGTVAASFTTASASQTGLTETLTYTPATGSVANGDVSFVVPAGWTAPQATTAAAAGYVTASGGSGANTIAVAGTGPWTVTVSAVTLNQGAADTLVMRYGDTGGGGAGATAPAATGGVAWTTKERSSSRGTLTSLAASPTITVYAADGGGNVLPGLSAVSGAQSGLSDALKFSAPTGGISNGTLTVDVPAGWTPPSTVAGPGYTTTNIGVLSVSGQRITVTGVTRIAGQTVTITYGSGGTATAAPGPGAQAWQFDEASTAGGVLTPIAVQPSVTIYGQDGAGTASTPTTNVSASQTGNTVAFTYTVAAGDVSSGGIKLTIPAGWSAPSTTATSAGYTTSSAGALTVSSRVVTVASLTLTAGSTVTITYGDTSGGGAGAAATATTGAQTWLVQERSTAGGVFTNIAASPSIAVNAADGSGTLAASIATVSASQAAQTLTFTYTAATGDIVGGTVTVAVPAGWTPPSTTPTDPGYTTASAGSVSVAGQTIAVSGVTLAGGSTLTIVYGDTSGSGAGATATATTGAQAWQAQEQSTLGGVLTALGSSPSIAVDAPDGSGTATSSISVVSAGQTGNTVKLTYTVATGGMQAGSLSVTVPSGWTPPATSVGPGYTTSSFGSVSVAGQTITISGITRAAGQTVVVTYGSGGTATATAATGNQTWLVQEASTAGGLPTSIAASPTVAVYATDGSGGLASATTDVSASQAGVALTFTYTADTGGMNNGTVTLVVPTGWSAPSTNPAAAGFATSTAGTLTTGGRTITVSALTLGTGGTVSITYGAGSGATATGTTGTQVWQGQERSTAAGVLTSLGSPPSITVDAADGTGTMSVLPANAGNGSTGNTLTFTYTAAAGGTANGAVTVAAPAGWSAPSTTGTDPGFTTASSGVVSAAGQTITVSGVSLAGGATMTIVYGDTSGGGGGATASTAAGANTFQTQQQSTAGGVAASIGASPSVNVYAADGSGTMTTPTANVVNASTNTIVFTYKAAAAGGVANGAVALTVPADWPAPTAGNTTSSLGVDGYSGQTVTVSGLTLAANGTFTITYGSAAAPATGGAESWSTTEASTAAGTLTALAASPAVNVYAADGSGTLTVTPATVGFGSAGNSEMFTYTADPGGTSSAAVWLVVPAGWSAPSTTPGNPGYTVSSTGTVSVAGRTVKVTSVTLAAGATLTIVYGSGAPGATAPAAVGPAAWQAQSKATTGGTITNLGSSPSVAVAPAPASALTFPGAGLYGTASWTAGCAAAGFCGTATDNSGAGIQKVELAIQQGSGDYWDGSSFSSASPVFVPASGASSWSYAFPASSFPADGTYTVQTRATDNLNGVETPASTTFTIDQTPPSAFSLDAPASGQAIRDGQTVSVPGGSPTDANGIAGVAFRACPGSGACTFDAATEAIGSSTVSPNAVAWSSQPADGPYEIVARATDAAGNTTDSPAVAVTVDNTPPVHAIAMPSGSGAYLSGGTVYFKSDAAGSFSLDDTLTDATSGPASVSYPDIGTAGWTHAAEATSNGPGYASGTFSWSASPATPAGYVVTGYDVAGNPAPLPLAFVPDTTPPAGGSVAYAGGYTTVASVPIALDDGADSQSGIDTSSAGSELLQRASATLAGGSCGSFGSYTTIAAHPGTGYDDTAVGSGNCYRYRFVVLDNVGNSVTYTSGATVEVDTDPPAAFALSTPAAGFVGPSASVSATATDTGGSGIAQIEFRYCAGSSCSFTAGTEIGAPVPTSGFASQAWDLSGLTDGAQYTIVARATDAAGNTTDSAPTTVTLDSSPPTTTDNAPTGAQSSPVTVTLTAVDGSGSGVASTSYRVDGGAWQTGTSVVIAAPSDHSNDGAHTIDYDSVDHVGNTETVRHATVTIDTEPPSGAPVDPGSLLAGTVVLSDPSPTDPGAGVASVAFEYSPHGAGTWTTIGAAISAPWSTLFDTTAVADGSIDLREVISDAAVPPNVTTIDLPGPKVIDNTAPSSAAVTAPAPGVYVGGTVTLSGTASDATSGVGQMVFKVNGVVVGTSSGTPASVSWDSTSVPDGPASLTVEAKDVAGNGPTVSPARTIVVDNHPPTVTLDNPGSAVHGTVALTTETSADTTQVTFERSPAGAGTWTTIAVASSVPFSASLDTTALADGSYDLRASATDGAHVVTSNVVTTRFDNTAPTGTVTAPAAGATVGGPSVTLQASPADVGSGVAAVEFRVDGTPVGTATSAPWELSWDPSSTPSGPHTVDAVVTDAAGNAFTTPGVSVTVDTTPPSVALADPGGLLSGTGTLHASSPDADTARVAFQVSPAGAGTWTTVATDTTPPTPYSGSFDTTTVPDGVYDVRAIAYDDVGNASVPSIVAARRIDNTPPSFVSATPADGTTVTGAGSIAVTASEDLAAVSAVTLDGGATTAPAISGATATFATGPLADGPHTLAGTLVDFAGKTSYFTTHLTIVSGPAPATWPYVEMNALPNLTATLTSADGGATVTTHDMPSSPTDHLVLRVDPGPAAVIGGGFATGALVYDVSCYWSQTGVQLHSFSSPLEIVISTGDPTLVPATFENGGWQPIPAVPTAGILPAGWSDGYFAGVGGIHILTTHLSQFTLLHNRFPPPPPRDVNGVVAANGLTLRWAPGTDPTGAIAQVQLYVDGHWFANFNATQYETTLGAIAAGDPRVFTFTETDAAGNISAATTGLRALPPLAGLGAAEAEQALAASGFAAGPVTHVQSATAAGTVLAPAGVEVLPLGSMVDLTVSAGPGITVLGAFELRPVAATVFRPAQRRTLVASVASTRPGTATVALLDPRGRRLATWRATLRAGLNHPRLLLPARVRRTLIRRPGTYSLSWAAAATFGGGRASAHTTVRVVVSQKHR